MSGAKSISFGKTSKSQAPQHGKKEDQEGVVLLNGLPLRATYLANCRLCLSNKFGESSVSIIDEQFRIMLNHVFRFPITFKKGLPMNVCTNCYKGVELFYRYTLQVLANQKTLEEAQIPDQNPTKSMIDSGIHGQLRNPDTNRGKVKRASYDELQKEKNDTMIDVDMQCESASDDEEDRRCSFWQPAYDEDRQTHFVAVPDLGDLLGRETDGFECTKKPNTKPVEDAPFVIEIISASDDEYEVSGENESVINHKRTKHVNSNRVPILKAQSNAATSSQAKLIAPNVQNVSKLEKPKNNVPGFVTLVDFATLFSTEATDVGKSPKTTEQSTTNALPTKRSVRNIERQHNTAKSPYHFPRRSFN